MRKRLFFTIIILAAAAICMAADKKFTLVIDAGHGGHDVGAPGKMSYEKDINLKVALAFGQYVERNCSDVKVIYTRKTDVFVKLEERANIANRNKADLFISVHTNALDGGKISRGLETYTLGMHRAADNLNVAKRENSVILLEKNYKQTYAGFDPKSAESYIMFELMQDKYMANSVEMAKLIQSEVCASSGRVNKGVHQAGFLVLRETSMPSCLIELGFITTSDEEQFLNTQEGQDKMAKGIYNAFVKYKRKYGNVKMSANDDSMPDDNEAMLLAMADNDGYGMDNGREIGNKDVEGRYEQQIITDDGISSAATEYSEQREVRRIPSDLVSTVEEVPQPTSNPPQIPSNPPQPVSNPPVQTATVTTPVSTPPAQTVKTTNPVSTPPAQTVKTTTPVSTTPAQTVKTTTPVSSTPAQTATVSTPVSNSPVQTVKATTPVSTTPAQTTTVTVPKEQPVSVKKETAVSGPKTEPATEIKKDTPQTPTLTEKIATEPKAEPAKPVSEPKAEPAKPVSEPKTEPAKPVAEPKAEPAKPVVEPKTEPARPVAEPKTEPVKPKEEIPVHGPVFKVQIAATSQDIPTTSNVFQGVENIESYQENGMFKYTVGASPDFDEISNLRKELLAKFPQAFIIAFKDGEKTDLAKAIREFKTIKNKNN